MNTLRLMKQFAMPNRLGVAFAGSLLFAGAAFGEGDVMNFSLPTGYVVYGDAQSYALQVSCVVGGFAGTNCPWYVSSGDGKINNYIVAGTGPGEVNFPGMDNAYDLPNSSKNQIDTWFFRTGGQTATLNGGSYTFPRPDPGGAGQFTGDYGYTWDTSLSALKTFLTDSITGKVMDPLVFFRNNQANSNNAEFEFAQDQTLAAWARLWITDPNGIVKGVWEFTNRDSAYNVVPYGGGVPSNFGGNVGAYGVGSGVLGTDPSAGNRNSTDYVLSGGKICISHTTGAIIDCANKVTGDFEIDNNLGDNQAAYALLFPEMNAVLAGLWGKNNLDDYTLHADIRMGCDPAWITATADKNNEFVDLAKQQCLGLRLTNGPEAIFLGRVAGDHQTPEPETLALIGLGLVGIAALRRRRQS